MAANVKGAFANPLESLATVAARVQAGAALGGFEMPAQMGAVLDAVSVQQSTQQVAANTIAPPSPQADRAGDQATSATAGWRSWLTGWRLYAAIAAAALAVWYFSKRRGRG